MKIALILGSFSIGTRPIDFNHIYDSPRGLTGTDLAFIRLGEEFTKLGHTVEMFHNVSSVTLDDTYDVALSINEPNLLIGISDKILRVVYMFLNDFSFIQPGYNEWTDLYLGVCQQHTDYLIKGYPQTRGKWQTVPLGCDPDLYTDQRVPGRVVWCSSADRGLHWLLQQWHIIKQAVPEASLRIMYHFNYGEIDKIEPQDTSKHPHVVEMAQRIRYMQSAMERLKPLGVEHVGSVSRNQMVQEWNQASVFGFCCDTVAFSEGFSVSTLEAHASYTVPIISNQDCLGSVYADSGAVMIPTPMSWYVPDFTQAVIRHLSEPELAQAVIDKCRAFAQQHTWAQTTQKIIKIIQDKSTTKLI